MLMPMPKASEAQRRKYGQALASAMMDARLRGLMGDKTVRDDEWLAGKIGQSSQSIRNYLAGIREPRNRATADAIEDALEIPRYSLSAHLGYRPTDDERFASLEAAVFAQGEAVARLAAAVEALSARPTRSKR